MPKYVWLYDIGIRLYVGLAKIVAFKNPKVKQWVNAATEKRPFSIRQTDKPLLWMHCASVGEYEQGKPVWDKLKQAYPNDEFVVSFFSPSGYEFVKKNYPSEEIFYLPIDTQSTMQSLVSHLKPKAVLIVKYEFWYHLLHTLHRHQIPCYLVSGIFRPQQVFFRWYGTLHRNMLSYVRYFFLQNEESFSLLSKQGFKNILVTGDTRIDRVMDIRDMPFEDEKLRQGHKPDKLFIAGSVWNSDIPLLQKIIAALPTDWHIWIIPHELKQFDMKRLKTDFDTYSQSQLLLKRFLLIDVQGMLSKLYRMGTCCYVGGAFESGLHNILEVAVYKKPILIGNNYSKFQEAIDLVKLGCAFALNEKEDVTSVVEKISHQAAFRHEIAEKLEEYIQLKANVSDKISVFIYEDLEHFENKF
jgi:3-deoxy-D-manno-octulosonic-acid transferase